MFELVFTFLNIKLLLYVIFLIFTTQFNLIAPLKSTITTYNLKKFVLLKIKIKKANTKLNVCFTILIVNYKLFTVC